MTIRKRLTSINGNVIAVLVILGVLLALGLNVVIDTPPAHPHCGAYSFASGESGNGCP